MMESNHTSRRDLLQLGVTAGAASILAGCKMHGSRAPDVVEQPRSNHVILNKEESSKVLASEGSLLVEPKGFGGKIIVVHAKDDSLHALSATCTHMGCTVPYDKELGHIRCPCHGSEYDLDGHNIKGPATRPLKQYEVRNDDGFVVIALG